MTNEEKINQITKEIVGMLPVEQMTAESIANKRTMIFNMIFSHDAVLKGDMKNQINDLARRLYLAEKEVEDMSLSAGCNQ